MMGSFGKAVWAHPSDFGDRERARRMAERLSDAGFDLVIPCVKDTRGYLAYPSEVGKMDPKLEGDPLGVLVEEMGRAGLKVHPWMCVFPEGEGSALLEGNPELSALDPDGKPLGWACPRRDEVRSYELELYREVSGRYDVAGVHLDYIRYAGPQMCFCPTCRREFRERTGRDLVELDRRDPEWADFLVWRAEPVTKFVEELRRAMGRSEISAAVFPGYPDCVVSVGQDWADWARRGLVDFIFPMTYTNSPLLVVGYTRNHLAQVGGKVPVWEGLGKRSSQSQLLAEVLREQVEAARCAGAQGVVVFHYGALEDVDLEMLREVG
ncbi:MAG: hypothetical protein DRP99_02595 [Candidatus Latescibacterota bacterium]|nr:MAG: hypothetical protein DRP99_02595 [Candidatus Latescibacterota bacterium]